MIIDALPPLFLTEEYMKVPHGFKKNPNTIARMYDLGHLLKHISRSLPATIITTNYLLQPKDISTQSSSSLPKTPFGKHWTFIPDQRYMVQTDPATSIIRCQQINHQNQPIILEKLSS
jgi:hypothetical protein